jgi:RIO kinase 2
MRHPGRVYSELMNLIVRFARHGLIHCDFNEFNILIDDEERVTIIDFPQMVSTTHENADMYVLFHMQCIIAGRQRRQTKRERERERERNALTHYLLCLLAFL